MGSLPGPTQNRLLKGLRLRDEEQIDLLHTYKNAPDMSSKGLPGLYIYKVCTGGPLMTTGPLWWLFTLSLPTANSGEWRAFLSTGRSPCYPFCTWMPANDLIQSYWVSQGGQAWVLWCFLLRRTKGQGEEPHGREVGLKVGWLMKQPYEETELGTATFPAPDPQCGQIPPRVADTAVV